MPTHYAALAGEHTAPTAWIAQFASTQCKLFCPNITPTSPFLNFIERNPVFSHMALAGISSLNSSFPVMPSTNPIEILLGVLYHS